MWCGACGRITCVINGWSENLLGVESEGETDSSGDLWKGREVLMLRYDPSKTELFDWHCGYRILPFVLSGVRDRVVVVPITQASSVKLTLQQGG